jgi:hypothetical protein
MLCRRQVLTHSHVRPIVAVAGSHVQLPPRHASLGTLPRRDTPSYGQWIADGATTLWENWGLTATNGIA